MNVKKIRQKWLVKKSKFVWRKNKLTPSTNIQLLSYRKSEQYFLSIDGQKKWLIANLVITMNWIPEKSFQIYHWIGPFFLFYFYESNNYLPRALKNYNSFIFKFLKANCTDWETIYEQKKNPKAWKLLLLLKFETWKVTGSFICNKLGNQICKKCQTAWQNRFFRPEIKNKQCQTKTAEVISQSYSINPAIFLLNTWIWVKTILIFFQLLRVAFIQASTKDSCPN